MNSKRVFGVVILLAGGAMIFFSMYIMGQVSTGREQLSEAQSQVDRGSGLFDLNPLTKEIGKGITGSAQRKIDRYGKEADQYAQMASWLKIGGIVLIIVGAGTLFLGRKKRT
jgi:hypothetical protein